MCFSASKWREQFLKCLRKTQVRLPKSDLGLPGHSLHSKHDYKAIQVKAEHKRLRYLKFYHHRESS